MESNRHFTTEMLRGGAVVLAAKLLTTGMDEHQVRLKVQQHMMVNHHMIRVTSVWMYLVIDEAQHMKTH